MMLRHLARSISLTRTPSIISQFRYTSNVQNVNIDLKKEFILKQKGKDLQDVKTSDLFKKGRKVVIVGVPGAFTPVCNKDHLPGYIKHAQEFKKKGYDIVTVSVNDAFVMEQWKESLKAGNSVQFLGDPDASFTKNLGMSVDLQAAGLGGLRSKRYAMVVEDGKIKHLAVENSPAELKVSDAIRY